MTRKICMTLALGLCLFFPTAPFAAGPVKISNVTIFETSPNAQNGATFLTIINEGDTPVKLVAATSDVAQTVELHTTKQTAGGVLRMRAAPHFEIAPNATHELNPQGDHIMLMGLKKPLTAGDSVTLTLEFDNGEKQPVTVTVESRHAPTTEDHSHHH